MSSFSKTITKSNRKDKRILGEIKKITTLYNDNYDKINTSNGEIKLKLEIQNDIIRHWHIYVHKDNFKSLINLYDDFNKLNIDNIVFEILLPNNYPFEPPFIRIIKPIFITGSGYITSGGSMCMEILSTKGWNPGSSIDQTLVYIIQLLLIGNARLDHNSKYKEYGLEDAKKMFKKVMSMHPTWNK